MEHQASIKRKMDMEAALSYAYAQGLAEGRKKALAKERKRIIRRIIRLTDWNDTHMAKLTGVDLAFIKLVRTELEKEE